MVLSILYICHLLFRDKSLRWNLTAFFNVSNILKAKNIRLLIEKAAHIPDLHLNVSKAQCLVYFQNEAAKEFEDRHKKDLEKVKEMDLEEWVWQRVEVDFLVI